MPGPAGPLFTAMLLSSGAIHRQALWRPAISPKGLCPLLSGRGWAAMDRAQRTAAFGRGIDGLFMAESCRRCHTASDARTRKLLSLTRPRGSWLIVLRGLKTRTFVVPRHGADLPTPRSLNKLGGDHAAGREGDSLHGSGLRVRAEAMRNIPEDLRGFAKLHFVETSQVAGTDCCQPRLDELTDRGYLRRRGGVIDQKTSLDEELIDAFV